LRFSIAPSEALHPLPVKKHPETSSARLRRSSSPREDLIQQVLAFGTGHRCYQVNQLCQYT